MECSFINLDIVDEKAYFILSAFLFGYVITLSTKSYGLKSLGAVTLYTIFMTVATGGDCFGVNVLLCFIPVLLGGLVGLFTWVVLGTEKFWSIGKVIKTFAILISLKPDDYIPSSGYNKDMRTQKQKYDNKIKFKDFQNECSNNYLFYIIPFLWDVVALSSQAFYDLLFPVTVLNGLITLIFYLIIFLMFLGWSVKYYCKKSIVRYNMIYVNIVYKGIFHCITVIVFWIMQISMSEMLYSQWILTLCILSFIYIVLIFLMRAGMYMYYRYYPTTKEERTHIIKPNHIIVGCSSESSDEENTSNLVTHSHISSHESQRY